MESEWKRKVNVEILCKKPLCAKIIVHEQVSSDTVDKRIDEALESASVEAGVFLAAIPSVPGEPINPGTYPLYDPSASEEELKK